LESQLAVEKMPMPDVPTNIIYNNPTLENLTEFMISTLERKSRKTDTTQIKVAPWAHIERAVEKYSAGLEEMSPIPERIDSKAMIPAVVLLTGSTGNLGSYLLTKLVHDNRIDRIYCLNRVSNSSNSRQRQENSFKELGLDVDMLASPKVILLEGDASKDKFGLADDIYAQVHVFFSPTE
jgi:hypothetical protein